MTFTALHRALGLEPGPLTSELLDRAVATGVMEATDLDWKAELPQSRGLSDTDFPKDVAAMANSGGGVIIFGVREAEKAATERIDAGECDENFERSIRMASVNAISPPVFGLTVHRLGVEGSRAVVVEVPASVDGPHLIYRKEYFGAPMRNDADTVWMKERQIETMYRARFDERRHAGEAMDRLFTEASAGRDTDDRAWLTAVAHPRVPHIVGRSTREQARRVLRVAESLAPTYTGAGGPHPLQNIDLHNPRSGLRRWVATNREVDQRSSWKEAWASVHDDGSVSLAAAVGAHRVGSTEYLEGWTIMSSTIEFSIAAFMALVRSNAEATGSDEYEIRVGVRWSGERPLEFFDRGGINMFDGGSSVLVPPYVPIELIVDARESDADFHQHVRDLAQDCVNQGGISDLRVIQKPPPEQGI